MCGAVAPQPVLNSLYLLALGEVFCSTKTPLIMCCLTTDPTQWGQLTMDWNLQKCEPNKPFLILSWLSQIFCYSITKVNIIRIKLFPLPQCKLSVNFYNIRFQKSGATVIRKTRAENTSETGPICSLSFLCLKRGQRLPEQYGDTGVIHLQNFLQGVKECEPREDFHSLAEAENQG
jgi:hypothetical protein